MWRKYGDQTNLVSRKHEQRDEGEVLVGDELLGDGGESLLHWGLVLAGVLKVERGGGDEGHELQRGKGGGVSLHATKLPEAA